MEMAGHHLKLSYESVINIRKPPVETGGESK
jgi:hypothetical protein